MRTISKICPVWQYAPSIVGVLCSLHATSAPWHTKNRSRHALLADVRPTIITSICIIVYVLDLRTHWFLETKQHFKKRQGWEWRSTQAQSHLIIVWLMFQYQIARWTQGRRLGQSPDGRAIIGPTPRGSGWLLSEVRAQFANQNISLTSRFRNKDKLKTKAKEYRALKYVEIPSIFLTQLHFWAGRPGMRSRHVSDGVVMCVLGAALANAGILILSSSSSSRPKNALVRMVGMTTSMNS